MTNPTDDLERQPGAADAPVAKRTDWGARIVLVLIAVILLAVAVLLGITVLPRWWAHRVGAVADGSMTAGIFAGLTCGAVFTTIPLLLLRMVFGRHRTWTARLVWLLAAAIVAIPNLTTLMIVLGTGNAAHAGERTMDVDAPGFRGATLVGAVLGALFVVVLWSMLFSRRRRKRELVQLRAERDRLALAEKQGALADVQTRDEQARDEQARDEQARDEQAREEHVDERERDR